MANASPASFWRVSGLTLPCVLMSRRTDAYWVGLETAATPGKFLAAARRRATPPMSICSSAWSRVVPGLPHRLGERVEVHDNDVDLLDPVLGQLGEVIGLVPSCQEPGEDVRVEGLDPAAEDFVCLGQVGDGADALDARLGQVGAGAIGGEAFDPGVNQAFGELDDAVTITDGEKGAQSTSS